jgi:hypothetical protein
MVMVIIMVRFSDWRLLLQSVVVEHLLGGRVVVRPRW